MDFLDDVDREIIRVMQLDGRITMTGLAELVHLSQPAASARLHKLEDAGYIVGYAARIDAARLGLSTHAVIRLRTTHGQIATALELFASLPAINRIYRITGEDCFVLDAHTATPEDLETVIDAIGRFGPVSTSLVLREYPAHPIAPTHDR